MSTRALPTLIVLPLLFAPVACDARPLGGNATDSVGADVRRAVWVWEEASFALLDRERSWEEFASFLERHGLSTVYLYADRYRGRNIIGEEPTRYRRLLRFLHGEGLDVFALLGSIHLHTEEYVLPEKRPEARAMLRRVLRYNREADAAEQFDGVNVDVEPYLLDEWDADREYIARRYLDLSRLYMEMKEEHGFGGPVGPAMPFWFDGIDLSWNGESKPLSEHTQDLYDYVTIMAYRDRALGSDGIVRHVTDELRYATSRGKRVVVGVETAPGELDKVTFHGEGPAEMEEVLTVVARELGGYEAFGGFAIHHYASYREWVGTRER